MEKIRKKNKIKIGCQINKWIEKYICFCFYIGF